MVRPEPLARRTVEGDLGVFVNARHVVEMAGEERLCRELGFDVRAAMERLSPFPSSGREVRLVAALTRLAGARAILEGIKGAHASGFLLPGPDAQVLIDRDYIMASAGVLAAKYPRGATELVMASLGLRGEGRKGGSCCPAQG